MTSYRCTIWEQIDLSQILLFVYHLAWAKLQVLRFSFGGVLQYCYAILEEHCKNKHCLTCKLCFSASPVFDVLVAFVLVFSTCSNVHTSLCLYKSDFRCILVYLYVFKTGPKVILQQCLWLGVIINYCSSHSLDLKIM